MERHSDLTRKWLDRERTNREDGERWWHRLKVKGRRTRDILILHCNDLIGKEQTERKRWHRLKVKGWRRDILILHSYDLIGNKQTERKRWHILKEKGWRRRRDITVDRSRRRLWNMIFFFWRQKENPICDRYALRMIRHISHKWHHLAVIES